VFCFKMFFALFVFLFCSGVIRDWTGALFFKTIMRYFWHSLMMMCCFIYLFYIGVCVLVSL
jgi:hypothetical protein